MKCKEIQNQLEGYIDNSLSDSIHSEIKIHLESCKDCRNELEEMKQFLLLIADDKMEIPSDNLRANFEKMLAQEKRENPLQIVSKEKLSQKTQKFQNNNKNYDWRSYIRVAASIVIVISAFLIGKYQSDIGGTTAVNKQKLESENQLLGLIEDQSASKRILAVSNSENFTTADTKIIQALIDRLYFDKNTNVRLAAVEALSKFTSEEIVKTALIKALETEKKPSILIELIQTLAKIQEKRAIEPMKKMLADKEIPSYVKQELQLNLPSLL